MVRNRVQIRISQFTCFAAILLLMASFPLFIKFGNAVENSPGGLNPSFSISGSIPISYSNSLNDYYIENARMVLADDDFVYVAGNYPSQDLTEGVSRIELIKWDSVATLMWNISWITDSQFRVGAIDADTSGVLVAGQGFNGSIRFAKWDYLGSFQWQKSWNSLGYNWVTDIGIDTEGSIFIGISAFVSSSYPEGWNDQSYVLMKCDSLGNMIWNRTLECFESIPAPPDHRVGVNLFMDFGLYAATPFSMYEITDGDIISKVWDDTRLGLFGGGRGIDQFANGDFAILRLSNLVRVNSNGTNLFNVRHMNIPLAHYKVPWGVRSSSVSDSAFVLYPLSSQNSPLLKKFNAVGDQIWNASLEYHHTTMANDIEISNNGFLFMCANYPNRENGVLGLKLSVYKVEEFFITIEMNLVIMFGVVIGVSSLLIIYFKRDR